MAKFLQRITVVDPSGRDSEVMFKDKKRKKKKVTRWMRPSEKAMRQYIKAERRCWDELLDRHDKSRGKKRDRWLTDVPNNALRALDKGLRVFGKL